MIWVSWAIRAEDLTGRYAVHINNLVLGGIDDRVGDITGSADQIAHKQHCDSRCKVAFAGPDQPVVIQLEVPRQG